MNKPMPRVLIWRYLRNTLIALACLVAAIALPVFLQKSATHRSPVVSGQSADAKVRTPASKPSAKTVPQHGEKAWNYTFADMPDGRLPGQDWNFTVGTAVSDYNNEAQAYTARSSNVRVENGTLVIEAKPESFDGKQYTSARIDTKGIFDFTYGTFEVDMKVPTGNGTWPAAWLLPADNKYAPADYGIAPGDPYGWALNGEIDFGESIGSIPGQNIPAIHSYNEVHRAPTYTPAYIPDSATAYHRYGVIKTPDKIVFTMDGKPYTTRLKTSTSPLEWPYDQPYYLVIDLALGGSWAGAHGIDTTTAPWQLHIKSISYTPYSP